MSDVAELKKLVKDLQNTTINVVCTTSQGHCVHFVRTNAVPFHFQERVSILQILKKNFQVNEAILRVSIRPR